MDNVAFDVIVLILLVALIALVAGLFLRTRRIGRDSASTSPTSTSGSRQEATTRGEVAPHASAAATSGTGAMPSTPTPSAVTSGEGRPADPDPSSLAGGRATGAASVTSSGSAEGVDRDTGPWGGEHGSAALVERAAQLRGEAERTAAEIRAEADEYHRAARRRADQVLREAQQNRHEADDEIRAQRGEVRELRLDLERREHRVAERETRLDGETNLLHAKLAELDQGRAELADQVEQAQQAEARRVQELERVAGLSSEQAKQELVASVEHDAKRQAILLARSIESSAQAQAESKARSILVSAIQRLASDQTAESVVAAVHLPSDEMKGRIIGREGRNIRSFEQVTGVNVLIDDTPETVLLSCFDPVRREAARLTLAELIEDGRIHPVRIEEVHERSQSKITERCLRAAEDALADVGISDLHTELVPILGTLRYRTSYGQNVLKHSVECAHLAGVMAAELGLDVAVCKRSAFLHDIGKALTHEVEGSHALIGADLARKYGEHPDVVHAIEAHHNEVEPQTVEAVLTQAADAISGSRPGARRESLEAYVERLDRLEEIALAHDGVEKVFAMQAGREVRVMVSPDVVDDIAAQVLARDIVKQVEEELTYPGQIRVTVVRESRAVETAR